MMTSLNDEARDSVLDTLETLRQWSNEIDATNDRYLTKALDRIAAAERAMGWPDHVSTSGSVVLAGKMHYFLLFAAVRDNLLKASKLQTPVIDKVAEACFASRLI
jgi:hypothetical protein